MPHVVESPRELNAHHFIQLGNILLHTATHAFGHAKCTTRLICYNMQTGFFIDTPNLATLTDKTLTQSAHVHLAIKPVDERRTAGYVTSHGNYMPALAFLQFHDGKLRAEINGGKTGPDTLDAFKAVRQAQQQQSSAIAARVSSPR